MIYSLKFEKDPTWRPFHADNEVRAGGGFEFVPKYFWYVENLPYAISPGLNSLIEAKQWFELKFHELTPSIERREPATDRRWPAPSAMAFASRFDRRRPSGRRWTDQIAQYSR